MMLMKTLSMIRSGLLGILKTRTLGARALVLRGDAILLVRHTYTPGWYMPGGGIDPGETPLDAVEREVYEEAGVVCEAPPRLVNAYHNPDGARDDYILLYEVRDFEIRPVTSAEIAESRWFPLHALPEDIAPGTRRRIEEHLGQRPVDATW